MCWVAAVSWAVAFSIISGGTLPLHPVLLLPLGLWRSCCQTLAWALAGAWDMEGLVAWVVGLAWGPGGQRGGLEAQRSGAPGGARLAPGVTGGVSGGRALEAPELPKCIGFAYM